MSVGQYIGVLVSRSIGLLVCQYVSLSVNARHTSVCQYIHTLVHPCVGACPRRCVGVCVGASLRWCVVWSVLQQCVSKSERLVCRSVGMSECW